ncbi:chemotaxis protein CheR [Microcoleus sp. LEGE 07076]|uniref:CheR family methyltransferase n=1 Tax=Microcoleus sp. LEGE 07076 TaxID=915322 RepID=UPI001882FAD4|nr:protein-glutamate O-methyltransferase CheR [Microcoleus sp. LEGE 07076]MBE9184062.1 chemotaxis protein CheR [Microcoleus sp. LEGE 07076]
MNDAQIQLFIQLIATHTGLEIRPPDRSALAQKLLTRMKAVKIAFPEKYYQMLAAPSQESKTEWRQLALLLTTNESYFMRDKGQLSLLEKVIFPELIDRKIKLYEQFGIKPALRIWSAGCSTGEEPYSLVIILKQLICDWEKWNILVLGTDINQQAIEKAQRGIYSPWSFRLVDPKLQTDYFDRRKTEWEIDKNLRQFVTFSHLNLVKDDFPNIYQNIYNMDLILCRNVFVYFEAQYISQVLKKFAKTLRVGGYLMTGHAEVHSQAMNEFQAKIFPESVVYQTKNLPKDAPGTMESSIAPAPQAQSALDESRKAGKVNGDRRNLLPGGTVPASLENGNFGNLSSLLAAGNGLGKMLRSRYFEGDRASKKVPDLSPTPEPKKLPTQTPQMLILEAKACFKNKAYPEAIDKAKQAIDLQCHNFDADYLLAQIYANLGKYSQAIEHCKRASKVDAMSVFPYFLQAHIAEEQGDLETAKSFLKKTIYLCPSFVSAYLELGNIYNKEGQLNIAVKMYNSSCDILKKLPPNTPIEQQGKMTANQVLMDVEKKLVKLYSQQK